MDWGALLAIKEIEPKHYGFLNAEIANQHNSLSSKYERKNHIFQPAICRLRQKGIRRNKHFLQIESEIRLSIEGQ